MFLNGFNPVDIWCSGNTYLVGWELLLLCKQWRNTKLFQIMHRHLVCGKWLTGIGIWTTGWSISISFSIFCECWCVCSHRKDGQQLLDWKLWLQSLLKHANSLVFQVVIWGDAAIRERFDCALILHTDTALLPKINISYDYPAGLHCSLCFL